MEIETNLRNLEETRAELEHLEARINSTDKECNKLRFALIIPCRAFH
jgi:chromosome segregation ATPase